jgi:hypothetical protein
MPSYSYRVLKAYETEREAAIAKVVGEIVGGILKMRVPPMDFIEEATEPGDITLKEPIRGLYHLNRVYILHGLPDDDLVWVCSHELRHAFQVQRAKYCGLLERERDADLFAREFHAIHLGSPASKIVARRLVTVYGMKCGKELSRNVKDILNKGDLKNAVYRHQFEC